MLPLPKNAKKHTDVYPVSSRLSAGKIPCIYGNLVKSKLHGRVIHPDNPPIQFAVTTANILFCRISRFRLPGKNAFSCCPPGRFPPFFLGETRLCIAFERRDFRKEKNTTMTEIQGQERQPGIESEMTPRPECEFPTDDEAGQTLSINRGEVVNE
jgi:hypothetical protein